MKIAVTGASGFLGGYVLSNLAKRDVEVIAVARNTSTLENEGYVQWIELDIHAAVHDPFEVLGRPDVLLHLAWGGLPNYRDPYQTTTELPAQKTFLDACLRGGLKELTVTGTCLEYGMQSGRLSEDFICEPTLPYPQAKLALLRHLQAMKSKREFNFNWGRLFYMYGAGQQEKSLYSQFLAAYARDDKCFDMSGGEQLRDFLPVEKVAEFLCSLALSGRDNGAINVCSGEPVPVVDLVRGWARKLDWNVELNLGVFPYPDYEPMEFWGDNRRLKEVLAGS